MTHFVFFFFLFNFPDKRGSPIQASDPWRDATVESQKGLKLSCPLIFHLWREKRKVRLSLNVLCGLLPSYIFVFFFFYIRFILCRFGAAELKWKSFLSLVVSQQLLAVWSWHSLFENPSLPSKFTFLHCCFVQSSLNIHLKNPFV